MKRWMLHAGFWLAYLCQDTLMQFSWMNRFLVEYPFSRQVTMAVHAALLIAIPKLLLSYYLMWRGIKLLFAEKKRPLRLAVEIVVVYAVAIVLFRAFYYYFINPDVYTAGWQENPPMFSLLGVLLAFLEIGFIAAIAVVIKIVRIQLHAREREKNLKREKLETELKFLRHQTNPHFLFNTLNNIYALAQDKSDETPEVVMKLSKLLRFMLYEAKSDFIGIGDEIRVLENYIELERIRYDRRLTVDFIRELDNDTEPVAPLILLPFVENAFKHGASESRFDSYIYIDLKLSEGRLQFSVENSRENGSNGYQAENIGLANVKRQLELIYTDYRLDVQREENSFRIDLTINLRSHAKI